MENNRTKEDLKIMQSWPLERKIQVTQTRIIEWYLRWQGMVYVSFSGGKDSTVLLDLARRVYPEIEAVFCDTGLEYPEIREFVKTKENVTWLHPVRYDREKREWVRTNFKAVIEEEGYPIISKSVSKRVRYWQNGSRSNWILKSFNNKNTYTSLNMGKWTYLKDAPFKVSERCCNVMKKQPFHLFNKKTGKYPIVGTMAEESAQRELSWLQTGCNSFNGNNSISKPMSFWTEQDVLQYIKNYNISYCSIYGNIAVNNSGALYMTGLSRTGCMFCMLGVHLEKEPNRFQRMKITHPKQYDYCINKLGIGKVLDYIGVPYN
jgi:3'-phosphoadenosine 5'-phosphosulfate sulfotransferase (PAPS reductase)/FAD synthetase